MRDEDYRLIKDRAAPQLFKIPGVNIVGIGGREKAGQPTGERAIKIFVTEKKPIEALPPDEVIPRSVEGVLTDVVEGGPPRRSVVCGAPAAQSTFPDIAPYEPLRGGISLAIEDQKGLGTIGCFLRDRNDATAIYALTNYHVVAAEGKLSRSRRIIHPGLTDPSRIPSDDEVSQTSFGIVAAGVHDAIRDAALVRLDQGTEWIPHVEDIGFLRGTDTVTQADADAQTYQVRKRGATTKLTGGTIVAVDSTVHDFYVGSVKTVVKGVMVIRPNCATPNGPPLYFSDEGDSGSVVVNDDNEVVGLLFGSDRGTSGDTPGYGFATSISTVLKAFEHLDHLQLEVATATTSTPDETSELKTVPAPGGKPRMTGADQIAGGDHRYYRPLTGGAPILVSPMLGFANATTLGCIVTETNDPSRAYILTSYSALSAANTLVPTDDTRIGQPDNTGHCCRCTSNTVGRFFKGGPHDQTPQVGLVMVDGQQWLAEVIQVGLMRGSKEITQLDVSLEISVVKYGGGTGLTGGVITKIEEVDGQKRLLIKPNPNAAAGDRPLYFSQFADRGSVVIAGDNQVVGVLYDEVAISGERDMYSVAAPIQWVLAQLQSAGVEVEVPFADKLNDVRQAAAARVIEARTPSTTPAIVPARSPIETAALPDGWRGHGAEVLQLIRTNRKVAAAWRRHGGPGLVQAVVRAFYCPGERIPAISDGLSVAVRIEQLSDVLLKYGSPELRATLSRLRHVLPGVAGLSFGDAILSLTGAVADGSG